MARKRAAHGNAAKGGAVTVWESTPSNEVRAAPTGAAVPHAPRDVGRFTSESAKEAARRRWEVARMPNFADGVAPWMPPSEALRPFDDARQDMVLRRFDEFSAMTGPASSGVGGKIRGWGAMHAGAEYWAAVFFATGDTDAFKNMVLGFKSASTAEDQARDAAAWEARARATRPGAESAVARVRRELTAPPESKK